VRGAQAGNSTTQYGHMKGHNHQTLLQWIRQHRAVREGPVKTAADAEQEISNLHLPIWVDS
jgi:hypothetical protein